VGSSWWWAVPVVVVALLVAAALILRRRRGAPVDDDEARSEDSGSDGEEQTPAAAAVQPTIPAPREEPPLSVPSPATAERRTPEGSPAEPAGSALAAIDSGIVGPAATFTSAAAAVSAATAQPGPYPGSLLPAADGTNPTPEHRIKAHEGSRRYHTPDSPFYQRTRGDAWFRTVEEARAAGFTAWDA
jgi:hypothetical protein